MWDLIKKTIIVTSTALWTLVIWWGILAVFFGAAIRSCVRAPIP